MRVTIGQPGLFPWWGTFAKAQASDLVIHLDHVSWQKGGYLNRFLLVSPTTGHHWCTLPLRRPAAGTPIERVDFLPEPAAATRHLETLRMVLGKDRPGAAQVAQLLAAAYDAGQGRGAADVAMASTELVAALVAPGCRFVRSSELAPVGTSTAMLVGLLKAVGGDEYVFGPGRDGRCQRYLDPNLMRRAGIRVGLAQYGPRVRCSVLQDLWQGDPMTDPLPLEVEWLW